MANTIEIRGQRIRLFGIDAPEGGQTCTDAKGAAYRCGQRAAPALGLPHQRQHRHMRAKDKDRYGRVVAVCRAFGEDLSAWMAGLGWALAYREYSAEYVPAEELARRRRAGMWSGRFEPHGSGGLSVAVVREHDDPGTTGLDRRLRSALA
jgi:endonuclease YncB( thermonuclease family)